MDNSRDEVSVNEFKLFYGIDRELYMILVRDLCRNPLECLQIIGLWLCLECGGLCNFISKILSLAPFLINEIADEALTCLKMVNNQSSVIFEIGEIPLTSSLAKTNISLSYFYNNRHSLYHNIQRLVSDIYIPVLSDIMETARHGGFGESSNSTNQIRNQSLDESLTGRFSRLSIHRYASGDEGQSQENESLMKSPRYARIMFATFSKGYTVSEKEVRQYFRRRFGNCIESLRMQVVRSNEQVLYAKIIFLSPFFIQSILSGESKAKLSINGKQVWIRQFVPRNGRVLPCGCPSMGPFICPQHGDDSLVASKFVQSCN